MRHGYPFDPHTTKSFANCKSHIENPVRCLHKFKKVFGIDWKSYEFAVFVRFLIAR